MPYDHVNPFGYVNLTRYALARRGPLTVTGRNEIIAQFRYKYEAEDYVRKHFGSRWRREFIITIIDR